jgi:hypothetical protein
MAKSRRGLPLPNYAVKALRAQRARQTEQRLAAGADWRDSGLVFVNRALGEYSATLRPG